MEADCSLEEEDNDDGLQPYNFEPAFQFEMGVTQDRTAAAVQSGLFTGTISTHAQKASPFLFLSAKRKTPMNPMRLESVLRAQTQWFAIMNNNKKKIKGENNNGRQENKMHTQKKLTLGNNCWLTLAHRHI